MRPPARSFLVRLVLVASAILVLAYAVRLLVIEPPQAAWACQVTDGIPWWCPLRSAGIAVLRSGLLGWLSVAAGLAAVLGGGRRVAAAAVMTGAAGLVLYAAGPAAAGVVLGSLRALRL